MIGTLLERHGWRLERLGTTHCRYNKDAYQFEVRQTDEHVFVTVPLPGSDARYRTRLDSLDEADTYLEAHLDNLNKIETDLLENAEGEHDDD